MSEFSSIDWQSPESVNAAVLRYLPQQDPFRYLDKIVELDDEKIVGQYTFKQDEWFYKGHFPGRPMTPGVILIETMAQTAVVAFGIYLVMKEQLKNPEINVEKYLSVFTDVNAEFSKAVLPGETVTVKSEKVFWRRKKLKATARLYLANGELAACAELSGIGVQR